MKDSAILCDEIIDAEGKSYNGEAITVATNFNEKKLTVKHKTSIFLYLKHLV